MTRRIAIGLLLAALAGCSDPDRLERFRLGAFGTEIVITARNPHSADLEPLIASINRDFRAMHDRWHAWEPGLLTRINRTLAAGDSLDLAPDARAIIDEARRLERLSEGLFNPAIGRLLARWGFHASELPEGPPPNPETIASLLSANPSMRQLRLDGQRLSSTNPSVQLDFGGYLKGVAVERALQRLVGAGIDHAIVNAGGDLGAIGQRSSRSWRAAVEHPDGSGGRYLATLSVSSGEFVFTSGNYRRYREDEGIRYGHIIDPRDGYPADEIRSVTVVARSGGLADAAATALAVAGDDEWPRVARSMGVSSVLRVTGDGRVTATPDMLDRMEWQGAVGSIETVSLPR